MMMTQSHYPSHLARPLTLPMTMLPTMKDVVVVVAAAAVVCDERLNLIVSVNA
jgi:hypothetical protein